MLDAVDSTQPFRYSQR